MSVSSKISSTIVAHHGSSGTKSSPTTKASEQFSRLSVVNTPKPVSEYSLLRRYKDNPKDEVIDLQTHLKNKEFYDGKIDGKFGPQTEAAVKAFQEKHGLKVDGKAGPITLGKLFEEPKAKPVPVEEEAVLKVLRANAETLGLSESSVDTYVNWRSEKPPTELRTIILDMASTNIGNSLKSVKTITPKNEFKKIGLPEDAAKMAGDSLVTLSGAEGKGKPTKELIYDIFEVYVDGYEDSTCKKLGILEGNADTGLDALKEYQRSLSS